MHKLHIGLDAVSGDIVASTLTGRDIDDGSQVAALLDQVDALLACSWVMALMIAPMSMRLSRTTSGCPCDRSSTSRGRCQLTNFPYPA